MNKKRVIGIVLLLIGVVAIIFAQIQKARIAEEGGKAYAKIEMGGQLFGGNPVGDVVTGSMKKKADTEISYYNDLVQKIFIGGIACAVVGAAITVFSKRRKR